MRLGLSLHRFNERYYATRFLQGEGIEIGACHLPLQVDKTISRVRYIDKLTARQIKKFFPELEGHQIVEADIICDVIKSPLPFAENSLDFVIANHLLEHCPNSLKVFKEFYRVLKNFGVLYLGLPDKRYTFDRKRNVTPLSHLIKDFDNDITNIDELHLVDHLVKADKIKIPKDLKKRKKLFKYHLNRSIHVHVWTYKEMVEFISYMIEKKGTYFNLLELYLPKGIRNEVIFVLQKRADLNTTEAINKFKSDLIKLEERESIKQNILPVSWRLRWVLGPVSKIIGDVLRRGIRRNKPQKCKKKNHYGGVKKAINEKRVEEKSD